MPYVAKAARKALNVSVNLPATATPGELAYCLNRLLAQYLLSNKLNFSTISATLGVLESVKTDFCNRILIPYEATKENENGDVWPAFS